MVFEKNWEVFWLKSDEVTGSWTNLHIADSHSNLYTSTDIIRLIKSKRMTGKARSMHGEIKNISEFR
jgi:hypothetical protein